MGIFLALGYMISSLFGIGVLLLPHLIQQIGIGYFIISLTVVAMTLNLAAYLVLELVEITGEDVGTSVKLFLGDFGKYIPALMGIFTYSALTAYVIAAGTQLSAWLGSDPHYWSTLFFILAAIPAVKGLHFAARTMTYLSMFLVSVVLFVIPINTKFTSFVPPFFGDLSSIPVFMALSAFALAGHFSVYEVHRLVRDEKSNVIVFFAAFAFAFLAYLAFSVTTAAVSPEISELSTATLAGVYPPFYAFLVSAIAVLAFYTSFVTVAHSFVKAFEDYMPRRSIYALLLMPIAFLYLLVRDYGVISLTSLVARVGGVSLLIFLSLTGLAHYNASKKWSVKFPPQGSLALSAVFAAMALIGLFL